MTVKFGFNLRLQWLHFIVPDESFGVVVRTPGAINRRASISGVIGDLSGVTVAVVAATAIAFRAAATARAAMVAAVAVEVNGGFNQHNIVIDHANK